MPPDEDVGKEEILEFEVASNDTNSAGLGVAVKVMIISLLIFWNNCPDCK